MPLTIQQSVQPRRLVKVQAKINTGDSWTTINGCEAIYWRPETVLAATYTTINIGEFTTIYKEKDLRGFGRKLTGVLWTRDSEAVEALVAASHLNSNVNAVIGINDSVILAAIFNTGLDQDNFRYMRKVFQPVVFGVAWPSRDVDWVKTLQGADSGLRSLFPLPWRLAISGTNTHLHAVNTTSPGMYSNFGNTANFS